MHLNFLSTKGYQPVPDENIELTDSKIENRNCNRTLNDYSEQNSSLKNTYQAKYTYYIGFFVFSLWILCWKILPASNPTYILSNGLGDTEGKEAIFDSLGRFILKQYDIKKPMANFLSGIGGLWGVPMWVFTVNRGQVVSSFGIKNKDGGISGFQTAEKAYQATPFVGFRTFVKGERSDVSGSSCWRHQPFFPSTDADSVTEDTNDSGSSQNDIDSKGSSSEISSLQRQKRQRDMHIGKNEIEIIEIEPDLGLRTQILYYTTVEQNFPALIRKVAFANIGKGALNIEALDGLAKLNPSGLSYQALLTMGRTMEAWMHVYNTGAGDGSIKQPFFHITQGFADTTVVSIIKAGHFAMSFVEDPKNIGSDGLYKMLSYIVDPTVVFGTDTSFTSPNKFWNSKLNFSEFLSQSQGTTSRTPCAFAGMKTTLDENESITITTVIGHANDLESFTTSIAPTVLTPGFADRVRSAGQTEINSITKRVKTVTSIPLFDQYVEQDFLDNVLRGGLPLIPGKGTDAINMETTLTPATDATTPSASTVSHQDKFFHTYSRIHGDIERDYNDFLIETTYYSQGPGNFRDVCQNRRSDVLFTPSLGPFNVHNFLSFIQADGYNPLTVASSNFIVSENDVEILLDNMKIIDPNHIGVREVVKKLLCSPWRPGTLFSDFATVGATFEIENQQLLYLITKAASQHMAAQFNQNGYWADHWTYIFDLIENYNSIYPDQEEYLLWHGPQVPFYYSPALVRPRKDRYSPVPNPAKPGKSTLRVLNPIYMPGDSAYPAARSAEYTAIWKDNNYVGDTNGAGALWQRAPVQKDDASNASVGAMTTFKVSVFSKLLMLGMLKFSALDPQGMGIEMEGGKPGWNDAMNGLPGLLGSGMPETYEAIRLLRYLRDCINKYSKNKNKHAVIVPKEFDIFLQQIDNILAVWEADSLKNDNASFIFWDQSANARERYREAVSVTFSGATASTYSGSKLSGLLDRALNKLQFGVKKALATNVAAYNGNEDAITMNAALSPTYFWYECTEFDFVMTPSVSKGTTSNNENSVLSTTAATQELRVLAFATHTLPMFLEGPTRHLKILTSIKERRAVYQAVKASDLYDKALKMFTVSESLAAIGPEIGRMVAFAPGWLENQSVWLHMSYKFYLELLRGQLFEEFFHELRCGAVPFLDPKVYGRSPLEAASFIVSSAFPDNKMHGSSFLARLSGSTAEFLSMWSLMFIGAEPFIVEPATSAAGTPIDQNELVLHFQPALPAWLFKRQSLLSVNQSPIEILSESRKLRSLTASVANETNVTVTSEQEQNPLIETDLSDFIVSFTFLGVTNVTYHNPKQLNTWNATITRVVVLARDGRSWDRTLHPLSPTLHVDTVVGNIEGGNVNSTSKIYTENVNHGNRHQVFSVEPIGSQGELRAELAQLVRAQGVHSIDIYY